MKFQLEVQGDQIHTGDINKNNRLKETGFIGSLRWWFEVIVRGFNRKACDPTDDHKCIYNGNRNKICPACYLFGCTGWSRRVRLEVGLDNEYYIVKIVSLYPEESEKIESIFKVLMTL